MGSFLLARPIKNKRINFPRGLFIDEKRLFHYNERKKGCENMEMDKATQDLLKDLDEIVSINSVSIETDDPQAPFGKGAAEALEKTLALCEKYGMKAKNCNHMVGYADYGDKGDLIGILCHLDVVPAGDGWSSDPFKVTIKGDKIYGRGVTDDKGPAMAAIHAMKELIEEKVPFNHRVRLIFGQAEETGAWKDMDYYLAHEDHVDYGFTPDAEFPAIYCEKGIANLKISFPKDQTAFDSIQGGNATNMVADSCEAQLKNGKALKAQGKSAHGSTPWDGDNAIVKLFKEVEEEGCLLTRFFQDCVKEENNGKSLGGYWSDEESGEISYNYGIIESDQDQIRLYVDIRYPITGKIQDIIQNIERALEEKGLGAVKIDLIRDEAFVHLDQDGPVMTKLLEAYREKTGDQSPAKVIGGGTYARAMEGIVAFGPMLPGREATEHMPDESILIEDLVLAKEIYKSAIKKLVD